jgi:integrase
MAILADCPICHKKLAIKKKACRCGNDMDRAKRNKQVRYHLVIRLPEGKQRWLAVASVKDCDPCSLDDAKTLDAKYRTAKREGRLDVFSQKKEAVLTFGELTKWYLNLEKVKSLSSFDTVQVYLRKFNSVFGNTRLADIRAGDLENLQEKRKREGLKPKTFDDEINYAKTAVIKAFDNDLIGGDVLKAFRRVKKILKGHANRRERVLTVHEYESLLEKAPKHIKAILTMGYWTGMRKGEILDLSWDKVDVKNRIITLEAEDTKEGQGKSIPIGAEVLQVLNGIPRPIHGGRVFLYNGKPIEHRFETGLKKAAKEAGVLWGKKEKGGFIFHDFRHTFITDMRKAGIARSVTMSITGHAIRDMNERYDVVDLADKLDAIEKLRAYRSVVRQSVSFEESQNS